MKIYGLKKDFLFFPKILKLCLNYLYYQSTLIYLTLWKFSIIAFVYKLDFYNINYYNTFYSGRYKLIL